MTLFLLQHVYEVNGIEEVKLIGVFSSELIAQRAISKLMEQPGFKSLPEACFVTSKLKLDEYSWTGGFINWDEANT